MSSISSVSNNNAWIQAQMRIRPTAAQQAKLADDAFSKIDTSGQGSFDISGLTTAVNKALSASQNKDHTGFSSGDIQNAFSRMDSDGDGKVTKQEFSSTMSQLRARHSHRFDESTQTAESSSDGNDMGMPPMGGMSPMGGMPPMAGMPPSLNGGQGLDQNSSQNPDQGFTADELKAKLQEIGTSDPMRSTLINNVLNNFSTADADGNGKVSFAEAMKIEKNLSTGGGSGNLSSVAGKSTSAMTSRQQISAASSSSEATEQLQQRLMRQIMKMMEAYGSDSLSQSAKSSAGQLSVTA